LSSNYSRIMVQGQTGQKISDIPYQKTSVQHGP
jgi:hypothetical protein